MVSRIWPGKRSFTTKIGGVTLEVKPLTLENALRLTLLLSPYVASIRRYWPHLQQALNDGVLLESLLKDLGKELQFAPGDIVTAYSLLLNVPHEWIAVNATAKELIEVLPVLDRVNNLKELWQAASALGIVNNG